KNDSVRIHCQERGCPWQPRHHRQAPAGNRRSNPCRAWRSRNSPRHHLRRISGDARRSVQIASIGTLVRRLDRLNGVDLLVLGEYHHAIAGMWQTILPAAREAYVLGVTATPKRLDGRGLADIFDEMIVGPTVAELIAGGFLSRFSTYAPARDVDLSGVRTRLGDFDVSGLADVMSAGVVIGSAV